MNNSKNLVDIVKENYSLDPKSPKWVLNGGEIIKYVGIPLVMIEFKKIDDKWTTPKIFTATIESISDWDGITLTYAIKYSYEDNGSIVTVNNKRIIPEGFVFNNPEVDGWAIRFVPYSLHMQMTEEEQFYKRLGEIFL